MEKDKKLIILPEQSPLLSLNKSTIHLLVSEVCHSINEGNEDPVKALVIGKKLDELSKQYNESVRQLVSGKIKLQKGESHLAFDVEIKEEETGVKYDYSICNDSEWNTITEKIEPLLIQKKNREEFLKTLRKEFIDEDTGEVIQPPLRTGKLGYKLSLKK
ncbi:hypothetical protein GQF61_16230 [Sphingobacterium sp. DK4209]|uniref:Uncharacterized protein n=1 Tax=Sphingobacterium zhuxiongii TaxID=2662364 RepID=A0A5Q0QCX9_9SPHI|nr:MULTISPECIES: hypothetical protein [unclassified Sphingobacterium]MVZ67403.1 hypothetical protein [Sphingobacterium sp. DK4209]QGA25402.1 hypothetical protein GFH32_03275 [Sphingobacterium sp. dk4302]